MNKELFANKNTTNIYEAFGFNDKNDIKEAIEQIVKGTKEGEELIKNPQLVSCVFSLVYPDNLVLPIALTLNTVAGLHIDNLFELLEYLYKVNTEEEYVNLLMNLMKLYLDSESEKVKG